MSSWTESFPFPAPDAVSRTTENRAWERADARTEGGRSRGAARGADRVPHGVPMGMGAARGVYGCSTGIDNVLLCCEGDGGGTHNPHKSNYIMIRHWHQYTIGNAELFYELFLYFVLFLTGYRL